MNLFHSIRWKLVFAYLFVVLISISALGYYLSMWTDHNYESSLQEELTAESKFIGELSAQMMSSNPSGIDGFVKKSRKKPSTANYHHTRRR